MRARITENDLNKVRSQLMTMLKLASHEELRAVIMILKIASFHPEIAASALELAEAEEGSRK